jgi:hypothetical protein
VRAEGGEEVFRRAPLLRTLTAHGLKVSSGDPIDGLRRLLDSPAFWRLDGLKLFNVGVQTQAFDYDSGFDGHGDDAARLLAAAGALAHLGELGISSSGLTAAGAHHLVASGQLGSLEQLWLRGPDLGGDAILALLACAPRVRSLDLLGVPDLEALAPWLPPLAELHVSRITDETLAALGESRAAPALETLWMAHGLFEHLDGLRAFPRLRVLDLLDTQLGDPVRGARELVAAAPPTLRRLRLPWTAPAAALRIVARELGPRLEQLELSGGAMPEAEVIDELQAHVAGEVLASGRHAVLETL